MILMLKSERAIFRYVMAMVPSLAEAEDIVQDTALALWEKFDEYDRSKPFAPWACRFALNKVREHRRSQRARSRLLFSDELIDLLAQERVRHEQLLEHRREALVDCLQRLPAADQSLIEQHYHQNISVQQVAEGLLRTPDAVYKALQRIRRQLMECIRRTTEKAVI